MEEKKAGGLLIAAAALMTDGREEGRKRSTGETLFSRGEGALVFRGASGGLARLGGLSRAKSASMVS
jgi:hypothetical protein